jgi:hypothetical protein
MLRVMVRSAETKPNAESAFDERGYALVCDAVDRELCDRVVAELVPLRAGSRDLLDAPWCRELSTIVRENGGVALFVPTEFVTVQCILFDKSSRANWLVAMHQDLSIPVRDPIEHPELAGWSQKDGVLYVQPPVSVLENLVAVRVHLDDCGSASGPLRVVPGSHRHGRIQADEATALRQQLGETECRAPRGSALVMRPLLLHASSKAAANVRRRVLHFLYGPRNLPFGLAWHRAV